MGFQTLSGWGTVSLGCAHALSGHALEGLPALEQTVERAPPLFNFSMGGASFHFLWLAEAYLLAGRADDAARLASRALSSAREKQERGGEAWTLRLLGDIAAQADPPAVDRAELQYGRALALAEELGMRPLAARCHHGLGSLYRRVARPERAHAELVAATDMYRDMEMTVWLTQAEALLAQVAT